MTVPLMTVHGISVAMSDSFIRNREVCWEGFTLFQVDFKIPEEVKKKKVRLPPVHRMEYLSQKFLRSEYFEPFPRQKSKLMFLIETGTMQEDRAAFLAALCSHVRVPVQRH